MDFEDLNKHLEQTIIEHNNKPISDFEGYSANEMDIILRATFEEHSPIQFQKLSESDYKKIPILNQIKYLMNLIDKNGEIKLTKKGFLPTKIVSELYNQNFMKDELIERGYTKLYKETDSNSVHLARILIEITGLVKKRNGKLSLTKASQKMMTDDHSLLMLIFSTFANKFNWAYFDGYGENNVGQGGFGFTLILLSKYGHQKRFSPFYAEKYFTAYPHLGDNFIAGDINYLSEEVRCYCIRTFDRFLEHFGLVLVEKLEDNLMSMAHITKTELFDRFITCKPHNPEL